MSIPQSLSGSTTRLAALPVLAEHIPADLKQRKQWVCWRYVETPGKEKPDKRPYHPSGYAASTDKSATWTTFLAALDGYQQAAFDGIGFVLSPDDPYVGIDLDHCVSDSIPAPWADQTITALDTYAELSPSGTGVRLLLRGKLPASSGNRKDGIEAYDTGRFLTITGHVLRDSPIQARQEALEAFCRLNLPAAVPVGPGSYSFTPSPPLTDQEVFAKLAKSKNAGKARRLWKGDIFDYDGDDSRADAALIATLCFFTQDEGQIDRLVGQSKLGERPKWRNRADYRQRTIRRVLAGLETTWQPAPEAPVEIPSDEWFAGLRAGGGREEMFASGEISTVFGPSAALIQEVVSLDAPWEALDEPPVTSAESAQRGMTAKALLSMAFAPPVWGVPEYLPVGLTFLAGKPKVGKSWLGLQLAYAIGSGGACFGKPVVAGSVLYYALEDSPARVQGRMKSQRWEPLENVSFRFDLGMLAGKEPSGLAALGREITTLSPKLVVIDTVARLLPADTRTDQSAPMTAALGPLQRLALDNSCCIVLIDHHRKGQGGQDSIEDLMGSISKGGVADCVWGLYKERGKRDASLRMVGRDLAEDQEVAVTFDQLTCCWQPDAPSRGPSIVGAKVLTAFRAAPDRTLTNAGIVAVTGLDKGLVSRTVAALVDSGNVAALPKQGTRQPYKLVNEVNKVNESISTTSLVDSLTNVDDVDLIDFVDEG